MRVGVCLACFTGCNYSIAIPPDVCVEGEVRFAENYTNEYDTYDAIEGFVEICTNGSFTPVCYNESLLDVDRVANLSCQQLGYDS